MKTRPTEYIASDKKNIIFFDGVCNLCNGFVDFIIKRDKQKKLFFCSLQSPAAREILLHYNITLSDRFSTIYYFEDGKLYEKSKAILYILKHISPKYKRLAHVLLLIPNGIRNFVYAIVSKYRYNILGKKETCRIPTKEESARFIQ